jgi:hypothetical protein
MGSTGKSPALGAVRRTVGRSGKHGSDAHSSRSSSPDSRHSQTPRRSLAQAGGAGDGAAPKSSPITPQAPPKGRAAGSKGLSLLERRRKLMSKLSEEEQLDLQFAFCAESLRQVSFYYFNRPAVQDDSEGNPAAMW